MIRTEEIIFELIKEQMNKIMNKDPEFYEGYTIQLSNEQQFVNNEDRESGIIYMVVKFLPSSLLFGQETMNITIDAISEQNGVNVCRTLLKDYANTYNLDDVNKKMKDDGELKTIYIKQVYTSPNITSNFNEIYYGFRSLFNMSGTFIVSKNANSFDLYYHSADGNRIKVECMTNAWNYTTQLNTQPRFDNNNFTKSIVEFATFSFNFTTYLLDNELLNRCLNIALKEGTDGVNADFLFDIEFKNGIKKLDQPFKLVMLQPLQQLSETPVVSVSFIK